MVDVDTKKIKMPKKPNLEKRIDEDENKIIQRLTEIEEERKIKIKEHTQAKKEAKKIVLEDYHSNTKKEFYNKSILPEPNVATRVYNEAYDAKYTKNRNYGKIIPVLIVGAILTVLGWTFKDSLKKWLHANPYNQTKESTQTQSNKSLNSINYNNALRNTQNIKYQVSNTKVNVEEDQVEDATKNKYTPQYLSTEANRTLEKKINLDLKSPEIGHTYTINDTAYYCSSRSENFNMYTFQAVIGEIDGNPIYKVMSVQKFDRLFGQGEIQDLSELSKPVVQPEQSYQEDKKQYTKKELRKAKREQRKQNDSKLQDM
jgi:hypothetical protein